MNKEMLDVLIENQYHLPLRLQSYANRFPNVTFNQALRLYEISVEEVLVTYKAKHLFDDLLSFGRGLCYARSKWLEKMELAEKVAITH